MQVRLVSTDVGTFAVTKAINARISGAVQGVGFRAWTEQAARARGLKGWVRNRRDGTVEALIAGPDEQVDEMLGYLWVGPEASRVQKVTTEPAAEPMQLGFRILPTA